MPARPDPVEQLRSRRARPLLPAATPLVVVAGAAAGGVLLSRLGEFSDGDALATMALIPALLIAWAYFWRRNRLSTAACLLMTAVAGVTVLGTGFAWRAFPQNDLGRYARRSPEPVAIEAIVLAPPTNYAAPEPSPFRAIPAEPRLVFPVQVSALRNGESWQAVEGRCLVSVSGAGIELERGQRVRVFGQLRRPSPALNPGQDDAAANARNQRRLAAVWTNTARSVELLDPTQPRSGVGLLLDRLRRWSGQTFDRRLGEESATLARAMILGDGDHLSGELVRAFRQTGAIHALVVSGLHVGIVAGFAAVLAWLRLLSRQQALLLGVALAVSYVMLVGGKPPALRAAVVGGVLAAAALGHRNALSFNALAGAALAVLAASPGAWMATGTHLSFLAAATLLAFSSLVRAWRETHRSSALQRLIERTRPHHERWLHRTGVALALTFGATVAVLIVAGPLLAERFHVISPAAIPLAPVIGVTLPTVLLSGLSLGAFASLEGIAPELVIEPVMGCLAWVCQTACTALTTSVRFAEQTPGGWLPIAGMGTARLFFWYGWLAVAAQVWLHQRAWWGLTWRAGLAGLALSISGSWLATPSQALRCEVLAVGHGAATLVSAPGGIHILIDAGSLGDPELVSQTLARALWARGVTKLDAIMLSHADVDHYNGVPGLLEYFPVRAIWCSYGMFDAVEGPDDPSAPATLQRLLATKRIPVRRLQQGDRLRLGKSGAGLVVLHPTDLGVVGSDNANSVVLGLEHQGRRVLLPGDLESPGLEQLLLQEPYPCDVLLAPHHGSRRSNPPGFSAWCRPQTVLISSGSPTPATATEYRTAGAKVLNTFEQGALTVRIEEAMLAIEPFHKAPQR
ncbi:ComEC/Rec2 family competence protein [Botrimarina hoheduenensis]|uniref:ComEC family competence protein n=1 Tax=Botrimarina hoheduenensis TaxID=2528000 RepID=A0A5C5WCA9_9BACT|nr:ComEC/Rec2 family competence protein [Botrimarina hoheduenensis]TWT48304.1 ComEC family competence protein [Botrimarina hoheduenensis]